MSRHRIYQNLTLVFALLMPLALSSCTVNPATGKQSFTAFMSPQREKEVGRQEHEKILDQFGGVYDDPELGAYIARIGGMLARNSEMPKLNFTFTVLNDAQVNAFALPGGYVYITRGLLTIAADEAEVAGVLGHEIGHVTARHTAQRYSAAMATNIGLQVLGVLGSIAGVPGGAGQLASLGAQIALQSYSREQELESDLLGVRYLSRAGYDPNAMVGFFHKLKARTALEARINAREDTSEKFSIMSTHPLTSERIVEAEKLARAASPVGRKRGTEAYLNKIDGMIFGDDPEQGIVRGRTFEHPGLGIRFRVPAGFTLVNLPTQVVAHGPDDALIVFDMAKLKDVRAARSLGDYISRYWISRVPVKDIEQITINRMDAATGLARIKIKGKPFDARPIVVRYDRTNVYRLLFLSRPGKTSSLAEAYRRTTYSFRKLSATEAAAIKPLRIALRDVHEGDTAKQFADKMPMENFALDWFELLNNLSRDQALSPGSRVRVVVE
ncbi:MAG TPA: peptidase M48 [Rhodospirillales bacterium]|nr:peptidase M48 [Rhodospirillales bacterium]